MTKIRKNYILIPLTVLAVDLLGGLFTRQGLEWYKTINIPEWTPPGYIFSVVWITLFFFAAIAALIYWNKVKHNHKFRIVAAIFIANAILNALWSFLFFTNHLIGWALLDAILLEITIIALIALIWRKTKGAALLLAPYAIWVLFASYLNYQIWLLNM